MTVLFKSIYIIYDINKKTYLKGELTMMRLDKFLCENDIGTRSNVKEMIKKGLVLVNDTTVRQPEFKVNELSDRVVCQGNPINYHQFVYFMLNKPAGYVTAHQDNLFPTVMELLNNVHAKDLSPVGRLDKDTEGLLLITNDGILNHRLLTPKSHVPKTYYVELRDDFTDEQANILAMGVDIGEKRPCMPAKVETIKNVNATKEFSNIERPLESKAIFLTIHEGKFHQVKRMLQVVGNEVTYLKRIKFGSLELDESLKPGQYRILTENELINLKKDIERDIK